MRLNCSHLVFGLKIDAVEGNPEPLLMCLFYKLREKSIKVLFGHEVLTEYSWLRPFDDCLDVPQHHLSFSCIFSNEMCAAMELCDACCLQVFIHLRFVSGGDFQLLANFDLDLEHSRNEP